MGKITFGSLVSEARGKIGSQVFKRNKYGPYVQEWTAPLNTPSPARNAAKALMTELSAYFTNSLTDAQRAAWNAYGEGRLRFDRLHTEYALTGANAFMATNIPLLLIGSAQLDSPPLSDNVQLPGALEVTAFGGLVPALGVTPATAPDPDHGVLIWATPPLSPGRNYFYRHMRQIAAFTAGTPPPYDFTTQFLGRYSTLFEGQKVGIGLEFVNKNNGQRSRKSTFLATAESSPDIDMLLKASRTFTNAEILVMPSTIYELIPAPGVGKVIVPMCMVVRSALVAPYTNIAGHCFMQDGQGALSILQNSSVSGSPMSALLAGTDQFAQVNVGPKSTWDTWLPDNVSNIVFADAVDQTQNAALNLRTRNLALDYSNAGDFTGGDAGNSITVTVFYALADA